MMHYVEPCPRCGSHHVNDGSNKGHNNSPMTTCAWLAFVIVIVSCSFGPVGIALGLFAAAALIVTGIVGTVVVIAQRWYRCGTCQLEWCVYPWQT